jgi:hypothetical protein
MINIYEPEFIRNEKLELLKEIEFSRYKIVCSLILNLYKNLSTVNFLDSKFKRQLSEFRPIFEKRMTEAANEDFYFYIVYAYILISELDFNKAYFILSKIVKCPVNNSKDKDLYILVFSELPISIYEEKYVSLRQIRGLYQYPYQEYQHEVFQYKFLQSRNRSWERRRLDCPITVKNLVYRNQELDLFYCLGYDYEKRKLYQQATFYFDKSFHEFGNTLALLRNCYVSMNNREFDKLKKYSLDGMRFGKNGYDFNYYLGCYYLHGEKNSRMALRYLNFPFGHIRNQLDSHFLDFKTAFSRCLKQYYLTFKKLSSDFPSMVYWMDDSTFFKLSECIMDIKGLIGLDYSNCFKYLYVLENFDNESKIADFLSKYLSNKREVNLTFSLFLALLFRRFNNIEEFKRLFKNFSYKSASNLAYLANEISENSSYVTSMTDRDIFNAFSDGMHGDYEDFGGDLDDLDEMEGRG